MSTLEILNAIGEAHNALIQLPELEAKIRSLTDERDFVKLERDEAELTIQRLKARITDLENERFNTNNQVHEQAEKIAELTIRNASLEQSHKDLTVAYDNAQSTIRDQFDRIHILNADKAALDARLSDAQSFGAMLTETLRGIGQSIVAAVEVPGVTPSAPFPVSNTVGLPVQAEPSVASVVNDSPLELVDEPAAPAVVESPKEDTAAGCFPYRYW
jgi:hypothetical protein